MANEDETVREVCAKIQLQTHQTMFLITDVIDWRDRILSAHEREMAAKDAEIVQLVTECNRLKAALKPVVEIDIGDETKFTQTQVTIAVAEAQRIMKEGGEK